MLNLLSSTNMLWQWSLESDNSVLIYKLTRKFSSSDFTIKSMTLNYLEVWILHACPILHAYPMCHFLHLLELLTCLNESMLSIGFILNDVITYLFPSIIELRVYFELQCLFYWGGSLFYCVIILLFVDFQKGEKVQETETWHCAN